jgi:Zn-dependent metalloprotease
MRNVFGVLTWVVIGLFVLVPFTGMYAQEEEFQYKVTPVYTPPLVRPALEVNREALPRGTSGSIPTFDGEPVLLRIPFTQQMTPSEQSARGILTSIVMYLNWTRSADELRLLGTSTSPPADKEQVERESRQAVEEDRRRLEGRFGKINESTEAALREQIEDIRRRAGRSTQTYLFTQHVRNVPIDGAGFRVSWGADSDYILVIGQVYNNVTIANTRRLDAAGARAAAVRHIQQQTTLKQDTQPVPEIVLLPYGEGFRYAWKMDVEAEEGPYRVWVDAENGTVLQLDPQFFPVSGKGLVFNPSPNTGTVEKSFDVNAASGGNYRLRQTGVLLVNNNGADGVTSTNLTLADNGSGSADFNVAPINGTVVDRTSSAGYNSRFQEVNVYGWVYNHIEMFTSLGSEAFAEITATVNHNNPCGFGINNACASGNTLTFGIGGATTGNSTACSQLFNSAIDATVITHEFGHILNGRQYAVNSGTMTGSINEGLADFWAMAVHITDTFGSFWANNCPTPVQTGFVPRQAEPLDIFPDHRSFSTAFHADGQIIAWALWSARQELLASSALGGFDIMINLLKAMTTAGGGVLTGTSDRRVHDAFLNLLQQLSPLYGTSRSIHKILTGFARAGIYLSPSDAVIDIDDDFLNRNSATGPTFTVFTGRHYTFNASETVNTTNPPFNTRYTIEVANDENFTVNLVSSGVQSNVVTGSGGVATWTLPAGDWNTLKAQDQIYYRVTTTNATGGNTRSSANPGNSFLTNVPPARAVINETGECECACGASAAESPSAGVAFVTLIPLAAAAFWRFRLRRNIQQQV